MNAGADELLRLSMHLDELMDGTESERRARLADIARADPALAARLAALLSRRGQVETSDFLGTLPKFIDTDAAPSPGQSGERLGPYELLQELGHGGMSTVWLARRADGSLSREVALKLPLRGPQGQQFAERFARERDILAPLAHAHIARLYDAGISQTGQPFLAMEYVQGAPLTDYCDSAQLPIAGRLALFLQICAAVQFAHSQLVIHRDLKPSNILVTASGQVMLLDFGIAKLLSAGSPRETEVTLFGGRAMTINYASPEQVAGEPVGTASDIYSLGVLLFELLTGRLPYRAKRDTRGAVEEAILSADICLPSEAFFDEAGVRQRGTSARDLRKRLREDLDGIALKALQRLPSNRYATVDALALDVRRHLDGLPVSAHAERRGYRWRKFWRRNRIPVATAAGVLLLIVAGASIIAWEGLREREQARRADQEAARQRATKDFLVSVFKASDPRTESDKPAGTITAKELLLRSAVRIDREFAGEPASRLELLGITSDIFRELGEDEQAAAQLNKRMALARVLNGDDDRIVIQGLLQQASDANDRNDGAAARRLLDQADASLHRAGLDVSGERAHWWYIRSGMLLGDALQRAQMEQALRRAIDLSEAVKQNDSTYSNALSDLANVYFAKPDFAMAVQYNRKALSALQRQPKGSEGDLVQIYGNLASTLTYAGQLEEAQRVYAKAMDLAGRTYGFNHRFYWVAAARYAQALHLAGDYRRATAVFEQLMPTLPNAATGYRNNNDEHEVAVTNEAFGASLLADGRVARAVPYLETADRQYGEAPQYFYERDHLRSILGQAYDQVGRSAEARHLFDESIAHYEQHFARNNPSVLRQHEIRAFSLLRHGHWEEAEHDLADVLTRAADAHSFVVALAHAGLAEVALHRKEGPAAMAHSSQAEQIWHVVQGYRDMRMGAYVERVRAQSLLLVGERARALALAQAALAQDAQYDDAGSEERKAAESVAQSARTAGG